jgi:alpha,alpha-trehalose phosphorylase
VPKEIREWTEAAKAIYVPFDDRVNVHPQDQDFLGHDVWDFEGTPPEKYPLLLHYPYFELYRQQVVKQADLVLALFLCGDRFTMEQKRAAFEYYEGLTVRDSSLSACTQSIVAAEVGHTELAYDYLAEAAFMDIHDLEHNVADGVHMASLAGSVLAAVCGIGGLREYDHKLIFRPRLPAAIDRLAFRVTVRGTLLRIEVRQGEATYEILDGPDVTVGHHGEQLPLVAGEPVTRPIPDAPQLPRPSQPKGRAPVRRGRATG